MIRPPFLARVAAGVAVTAYEETLKLPTTAVALPMTTVSQILQTSMRFQQVITGLAIKGDSLFELLGAGPAEEPEWAVFDEDRDPTTRTDAPVDESATTARSAANPGRFALYSVPPAYATPPRDDAAPVTPDTSLETGSAPAPKATEDTVEPAEAPAAKTPAKKAAPARKSPAKKTAAAKKAPATKSVTKASSGSGAVSPAEIAEYLDYDSLTLAQLRARLRTLSVEDLTALLSYENAHSARTPFVTMLSNRIDTAGRK